MRSSHKFNEIIIDRMMNMYKYRKKEIRAHSKNQSLE